MRIKILVIILLSLASYADAKQVTQEMAQQTAQTFLLKEQTAPPQIAAKTKGEFIFQNEAAGLALGKIQPIMDENGAVLAYVEELEPEGFIITSADDAIRPILGFSFTGEFPFAPTKGNPLLSLITTDILNRKNATSLGAVIHPVLTTSMSTIQFGPWLLETNWQQKDHFDDQCPSWSLTYPEIKCAVGCVATAFAQILNYWDNTQAYEFLNTVSFNSSDAYVSKGREGSDPQSIAIDGDAATYHFPTFGQINAYFQDYTYDNIYEAYLSFAAGIAVKMNYGDQSGAHTWKVGSALRNEFSFGSARSDPWPFAWQRRKDEVIANIENAMPVQAAITGTPYKWETHSVVLDGYRSSDGYFHVNLGWYDTTVNFWYDLPTIDTPYHDYNIIRIVVYDIMPNQGWSQYGADAQNTFSSPYPAPDTDHVTQKWRVTCPDGLYFSDILIGTSNHVYAAVSPNASSGHSFLYVIDQFGTTLQQIELDRDGKIDFMCQSRNGELFAAVSDDSAYIYRIDPKQGSAIRIFSEPYQDQITTLKIDEQGWLFAVTFERVYALTRTGALCWAAPFVVPSGSMIQGSRSMPAIDVSRQRIYITYYNSTTDTVYLAALNRLNGQAVQTRDFGTFTLPSLKPPSLGDDGTVYIGMKGILYALDPDDFLGDPRWTKSLLIATTPAVGRDGTLYVTYWEEISSNWFNKLAALDPSTGTERWHVAFDLDEVEEAIFQPYIASNGIVIFTIEHDGSPKPYTLHAYKDNGSSAEELWEYDAGTSGGDYAFGPGRTVYAWGKTGLARTIYALSDGDVGDPEGGGMDFENNNPPLPVTNVSPADWAGGQDTASVQLSWACSDPDGHALKFDIYVCALVDSEDAAFVPETSQVTDTTYTLEHLQKGTQYLWSVVATDGQAISEGPVWSFSTSGTGVEEDEGVAILPKEFELGQNYPNPFNPNSAIEFSLPKDCFVRISIYNILGQKVRTLVDEYLQAGYKKVIWDSKNDQGEGVASGVYFYMIEAEDYTQTRKMVLLK